MTAFIINYILCSVLLYIPYKLWMERTSLHHFKRFYLLMVLALPLTIPNIEYNLQQSVEQSTPFSLPNIQHIEFEDISSVDIMEKVPNQTNLIDTSQLNWSKIVFNFYLFIVFLLLYRLIRNSIKIKKEIVKGINIKTDNYHIILTASKHTPYTFWKYIFINETDYRNNIHPSILKHEEAHVRQKHSIDIVISEVITAITWFNPINYFVRKDIINNHEHLADNDVIQCKEYIQDYCYLLLNLPVDKNRHNLTSQLNYKQVKNRLIMMTKKTSKGKYLIIGLLSLGTLAIATVLFTQKNIVKAKTTEPSSTAKLDIPLQDTIKQTGAPKNLLAEFDSVERAIANFSNNETRDTVLNVNAARMAYIASLMSPEQIKERTGTSSTGRVGNSPKTWITLNTKPKKRTPTENEFVNWQNAKVYGVWIDDEKAKNSDLKKFSNTDIVLYYVSKLHGKAKVDRSYTHQLNVYTQSGYDKAFANLKEEVNLVIKKVK